jgi:hypothetical protein
LAAHYAIARGENPDADIEEIVALVAERISIDADTALASESCPPPATSTSTSTS